jgi:hypothetical protein
MITTSTSELLGAGLAMREPIAADYDGYQRSDLSNRANEGVL